MIEHIPVLIITLPLLLSFLLPVLAFAGPRLRNYLTAAVLIAVNIMLYYLVSEVSIGGKILYYVFGASDITRITPEGLDFPIKDGNYRD